MHQELINDENILTFFNKEFQKRRTKKPFIFYKKIVTFYDKHPDTIIELVKNLYSMGYWKDYFILLLASNNQKLNEEIYNFLAESLKDDITNYKNGSEITTLAKWLPREGSGFDKKLKFVDKFTKIIFPRQKNKFIARRDYRKIIVMLNRKLKTSEVILCNKKYDELDFDSMGPICFKKNYHKFLDNDKCRKKIKARIYKSFDKFDLWNFISYILFKKYDDFQKDIILEIWKKKYNTFIKDLDFLNFQYNFLIDLSNSIFETKAIVYVIGTILLKCESYPKSKVYVNCRNPYVIDLKGNIFEKITQIFNNCCPSNKIYGDSIDGDLIILSNKNGDLKFVDKKVIYWDLSLKKNNNKVVVKCEENYLKISWYPYLNNDHQKILNQSNNLKKYAMWEIFTSWMLFFVGILALLSYIYIIWLYVF